MTNPSNDWESQSLTVLQLPFYTQHQTVKVEQNVTFNCTGQWTNLPEFSFNIEINREKTLVLLYNAAFPLANKTLTLAWFFNYRLEVQF